MLNDRGPWQAATEAGMKVRDEIRCSGMGCFGLICPRTHTLTQTEVTHAHTVQHNHNMLHTLRPTVNIKT